jgi:glycosyltransferase involved in cell wall biosynthesis
VITSTAGGCPEVVGEAARLVPPRDSQAIASELKQLIEDENSRSRLQAAAVEMAKLFSWRNIAVKYVEYYKSVIAKKTNRR